MTNFGKVMNTARWLLIVVFPIHLTMRILRILGRHGRRILRERP